MSTTASRAETTATERRELGQRLLDVMAHGARADFDEVFHPDAVNREAHAEPPATRGRGPEAFWATALWLRQAYSDLAFDVEVAVLQSDLLVTHGTMSGRHTGEFSVWDAAGWVERVFAPTGRTFCVHHAHFMRLQDGLVIEHWAVRDDNAQALQLGWIPPSLPFLVRCARATRRARRAQEKTQGKAQARAM